jgi:hypothetical protein
MGHLSRLLCHSARVNSCPSRSCYCVGRILSDPGPGESWGFLLALTPRPSFVLTFTCGEGLRFSMLMWRRSLSAFITALLLVSVTASASTCIVSSISQAPRPLRQSCSHKKIGHSTIQNPAFHVIAGSAARQCNVRGLEQLQYAAFSPSEFSAGLLVGGSNIPAPSCFRWPVSSIGFPETDRGPPLS